MVGELVTADASFWKRFHELRRIQHAELRPDDPLAPDEVSEVHMKKPDPAELHHYFEMSRGGVMISSFSGETVAPENPEYATNKHLFWTTAYVRPEERRKGVATTWLPVLVQVMESHGCTVAGTAADQDAGHGFLKWLGAEAKLTDIESRLNLPRVDWPMVERWAEEGASRNPQTRLEIYDGPMPDELLPDFAAQRTVMLNTMP